MIGRWKAKIGRHLEHVWHTDRGLHATEFRNWRSWPRAASPAVSQWRLHRAFGLCWYSSPACSIRLVREWQPRFAVARTNCKGSSRKPMTRPISSRTAVCRLTLFRLPSRICRRLTLFNPHLFGFVQGWIYVIGIGAAGGAALKAGKLEADARRLL